MKKFYTLFFALLCCWASSQNYSNLLQNTDWKIVKIQWSGTEYFPPYPFEQGGTVDFTQNNEFYSTFFNTAFGYVSFGANNAPYFTLQNLGGTLADYFGPNEAEVRQFDYMSTHFYLLSQPTDHYNFEYEEVFSGRNLTVTNAQGNKIFYSNLILGMKDEQADKSINLYPNPAKDEFFLKSAKSISGPVNVEILDAAGKLVSTQKIRITDGVKTQNLESGVYLVKVTGPGIKYSSKLIIKK